MAPNLTLLVGIDTEGDNQWSADARRHPTFENIYALPRLHALFARWGVRPTYLVTHPVATDPRSAAVLRSVADTGTLLLQIEQRREGDESDHPER